MPLIKKTNISKVINYGFITKNRISKSKLEFGDIIFDRIGYTYIYVDPKKIKNFPDWKGTCIISIYPIMGNRNSLTSLGYLDLDQYGDSLTFEDHDFDIIGIVKNCIDMSRLHTLRDIEELFEKEDNFLKYREEIESEL